MRTDGRGLNLSGMETLRQPLDPPANNTEEDSRWLAAPSLPSPAGTSLETWVPWSLHLGTGEEEGEREEGRFGVREGEGERRERRGGEEGRFG